MESEETGPDREDAVGTVPRRAGPGDPGTGVWGSVGGRRQQLENQRLETT